MCVCVCVCVVCGVCVSRYVKLYWCSVCVFGSEPVGPEIKPHSGSIFI